MDNNYTVQNKVHNKETDAWANNMVFQSANRNEAYAKFGDEIGRLFDATDFDFVSVTFMDTFGNGETKFRDDRVAPEPPGPEPEKTTKKSSK